jgi:hypothetical protein
MSQEETSCHRKKLPVTGRNVLSQEETPVTRINLLSREDTSCDRKKPPVTVRNFLSHEKAFKD